MRLEQLKQFYEENPNDSFLLFAIAKEYESSGQHREALDWYERLRTQDPDYVGTYYHLGKLYELLENTDRAIEVFRQGISVAQKAGDAQAERELRAALSWLEL